MVDSRKSKKRGREEVQRDSRETKEEKKEPNDDTSVIDNLVYLDPDAFDRLKISHGIGDCQSFYITAPMLMLTNRRTAAYASTNIYESQQPLYPSTSSISAEPKSPGMRSREAEPKVCFNARPIAGRKLV